MTVAAEIGSSLGVDIAGIDLGLLAKPTRAKMPCPCELMGRRLDAVEVADSGDGDLAAVDDAKGAVCPICPGIDALGRKLPQCLLHTSHSSINKAKYGQGLCSAGPHSELGSRQSPARVRRIAFSE